MNEFREAGNWIDSSYGEFLDRFITIIFLFNW